MNEIDLFTKIVIKNLEELESSLMISPQEISDAICYDLGEIVFKISELLVKAGYKKQEENNCLALNILAKSLIETTKNIESSNGKISNLFYQWIESHSPAIENVINIDKNELSSWIHDFNNYLCIVTMTVSQLKSDEKEKSVKALRENCDKMLSLNKKLSTLVKKCA